MVKITRQSTYASLPSEDSSPNLLPMKETEVLSLNSVSVNVTPLGLIVNLCILTDINSHYPLVRHQLFSCIDLLSDGDQLYTDEKQ